MKSELDSILEALKSGDLSHEGAVEQIRQLFENQELRDRFAERALGGLLASDTQMRAILKSTDGGGLHLDIFDATAIVCYKHADAMMKVRSK